MLKWNTKKQEENISREDEKNARNLTKIFINIQKKPIFIPLLIVLAILIVFLLIEVSDGKTSEAKVATVSSLEKIVDVSELSTFTAVYNGIAEVENEKNPEKVDYYVSYEAKVNAGIDFDQIEISLDESSKTIRIDLPDVEIKDVSIDPTSLDFIFYNKKANASTVTAEALKACERDVETESAKQEAIFDLVQENAQNFVRALVEPIVEQLDEGYKVEMQ